MSTQQSGLVSGNSQNRAGGISPRSRSKFPLSKSHFQTERFAEYVPFFVMEGVSGDKLPLHSNHEVQTYNLKFPILQSLAKKKDYFVVPMQAILPLNWEKFYTQPNIGQDVPDDSGCGVLDFWSTIRSIFNADVLTLSNILAGSGLDSAKLESLLKFLLFYEQFYSAGSLMESLGISGHNYFRSDFAFSSTQSFSRGYDQLFDDLIGVIVTFLNQSGTNAFQFQLNNKNYEVKASPLELLQGVVQQITLREALEMMRDDFSWTIVSVSGTGLMSSVYTNWGKYTFKLPATDANLNLSRLWAYQIVCAHFYSNDHVDYIYSADLFRQYIQTLISFDSGDLNYGVTFTVNGVNYLYDSLSAYYCNSLLTAISNGILGTITITAHTPNSLNDIFAYFTACFGFKHSLRFMDYFTGSRTLPLAGTMTTGVAVNSNQVDIIELSKTSMMTKFLQAVNRSGRKFSAYMQELFGKTPAYDYHNPMYLAHCSDLVGAQETDNTGAAQVSQNIAVTSRLKATSSRYAFMFEPDRDCVVIGISYYDLPRVYTRASDRQTFHIDRFDMFNPYLQFIGDQDISEAEIGTDTPSMSLPFAYTNRHMEYKQRFNTACGGFCVPSTNLRNWIFEADTLQRNFVHNITPAFIRSFNSEIDHFFQSLTGYSLGTYFHFIVRYDNRMDASRPMAYNPVIQI